MGCCLTLQESASFSSLDPFHAPFSSQGISIEGNDHYVSNTIVFSARVGVLLTGAANILNGVHTWNCETSNGEAVTEGDCFCGR